MFIYSVVLLFIDYKLTCDEDLDKPKLDSLSRETLKIISSNTAGIIFTT